MSFSFWNIVEEIIPQQSKVNHDHSKDEDVRFLLLVVEKVLVFKAVHNLGRKVDIDETTLLGPHGL